MSEIRLIELEFKNLVGTELSGIKTFKITPKKDKVVILGKSGIGKSRILKNVAPHAVTPIDLLDGGFIKHTYKVGTSTYKYEQMKSGKGLKCSVYKDNVAIIEGANPTVYNDCVKDVFGYDKKARDLLSGKIKFTNMSVNDRRYWFGQLATSDLSQALKYYKISKELLRDTIGGIKITERYISDMRPLVLKDAIELESLDKRLKTLETEFEAVNKEWLDYHGATGNLDNVLKELDFITKQVYRIDTTGLGESSRYATMIAELSADKNHREYFIIPRLNTEIMNLSNELKEAEYYAKNLDTYAEHIESNKAKIAVMKNSDNVFLADLVVADSMMLNNVVSESSNVLHKLQASIDNLKSTHKLSELKLIVSDLQENLTNLGTEQVKETRLLNDIDALIKVHNHTQDVQCVKCEHVFKPGVTDRIDTLEDRARNIRISLDRRLPIIEKARADHLEMHEALLAQEDLKLNVEHFISTPTWSHLVTYILHSSGFNKGSNLSMWFDEYVEAALTTIRIVTIQDELVEVERKQLIAAAATGRDQNACKIKLDQLEQNLVDERRIIEELSIKVSEGNVLLQRASSCDGLEKQLEAILGGLESTINDQGKFFYSQYLSTTKDNLWGLISSVRERKATLDKMNEELAYNESKLVGLVSRKGVFDEVVKELSPSDGILAEYLYRSIYAVTDSMNLLIEQIFTYPLVVKPCNVDDGELDYQFAFVEGESGTTRRDVSIGSDGQQETFNATFMLSAIRALGIVKQPCTFDEPGRSMDIGNRETYSEFISALYDSEYCSQLFIVSHDSGFHSKLGDVEYVVLGDDGVKLPDTYNENVVIGY